MCYDVLSDIKSGNYVTMIFANPDINAFMLLIGNLGEFNVIVNIS